MDYGKKVRIGNFSVMKYKRGKTSYIKVSEIGGVHSFEYREDCLGFHLFDEYSNDAELKEALRVLIINAVGVMSIVDGDFQHKVLGLISEFANRKASDVDEEKDREYLEEEKLIDELANKTDGE